jgi:prepilin-type N-terminal cleavage/methylation domain-containing protein
MKKKIKLDNQGLTLVELIIGLALASVIMAAIATFLVGNINFSNAAQDEIYIQEQVRNAMKVITDLAMDKESYQIISPSYIILKKGTKEIAFKYEAGSVKYIDSAGTSKVIASDIQEFKVEKVDNKFFSVTIKGIKHAGKKKKEVSFELTNEIFLRN